MSELRPSEHVKENHRFWNDMAHEWVAAGERNWAKEDPHWGMWGVPEAELEMLPTDLGGKDVIELGCGTGYVSGWMHRRGARCTGIDLSENQLATAKRLAAEHGADVTLLRGNAESVPLPGGSFDFAISEYGAATWCDPGLWVAEAHRLLRAGGRLHFLCCSPWIGVFTPENGAEVADRLVRNYFGIGALDWREVEVEPGGIEWQLTISDWFQLFRRLGFEVLDFLELPAPTSAEGTRYLVPAEWAKRFPAELVWKLRKR